MLMNSLMFMAMSCAGGMVGGYLMHDSLKKLSDKVKGWFSKDKPSA